VKNDPPRFRNYFLKGYSLVLAMTIPVTISVALFAPELIAILLGPKWKEAAPIFRLLSPTILMFALINPIGWLVFSLGMVGRSLKVAMVLAPVVITGYLIGLPHGPKGVALAYSAVMVLWVVPHIAWGVHGTVVSLRDIALTAGRPLVSGIVAGAVTLGALLLWGQSFHALPKLALGLTLLASVYLGILFYAMKQKSVYLKLLRDILRPSPVDEESMVPA
jgi:PST family polysaccharide transporter